MLLELEYSIILKNTIFFFTSETYLKKTMLAFLCVNTREFRIQNDL